MTIAKLTTAALSISLAACGVATHFTPTNLPPRPMHKRAPETVLMFTSSVPTRPFVEVGLVSSAHASAYSTATVDQVILALRTQAAEVGCDAVVIESENTRTFGSVTAGTVNTWNTSQFRAACVMFTDEQATVAAP